MSGTCQRWVKSRAVDVAVVLRDRNLAVMTRLSGRTIRVAGGRAFRHSSFAVKALLPLAALLLLPACERTAPEIEPPAPTLRRLTTAQYANAVHDLFGEDVVVPAQLEPDVSLEGFFEGPAARHVCEMVWWLLRWFFLRVSH